MKEEMNNQDNYEFTNKCNNNIIVVQVSKKQCISEWCINTIITLLINSVKFSPDGVETGSVTHKTDYIDLIITKEIKYFYNYCNIITRKKLGTHNNNFT